MVNYCSVYNCKNSSVKNPKLSFFLIPGDTFRQMIWLPKMGRQEWILKRPELLHKKRICNLFKEGIGEKGVNVNASTSASTSSMDIENNETVDECREISINPNIYTTPEKKPEETQTSPSLSSATPRKKKLQSVVIMARGIQHNWKQPVAYFFVHNSCEVKYLHEIITTSIRKLSDIGLNILALISDQAAYDPQQNTPPPQAPRPPPYPGPHQAPPSLTHS
ncbi:uncharacterized protein LOC123311657 [Coccinella septempunctata]|uniref:uncharacterized protein LOC123311657 n=1 Tax=Coccinella septempunctata TaxID=41139 RepID=UPI001D07C7BD|nr:uncharacterized protein LOC123311657 [Coccinella septempunctata]